MVSDVSYAIAMAVEMLIHVRLVGDEDEVFST